jgi:hypothetical protein
MSQPDAYIRVLPGEKSDAHRGVMVEVDPGRHVNLKAALALGLIPRGVAGVIQANINSIAKAT